jgi:hypothetical protein
MKLKMLSAALILIVAALTLGVSALGNNTAVVEAAPQSVAQLNVSDAAPTVLDQRVPAGEMIDAAIPLNAGQRTQIVSIPGAAFIRVHFGTVSLAPGDSMTVSAPDGTQARVYAGDVNWAHSVFGESALVTLNGSDASSALIDRFLRGYTEAEVRTRSQCGSLDFLDLKCVNPATFPDEIEEAESVVRVLFDDYVGNPPVYDGSYYCTAWRVTPSNVMATNDHCFNQSSPTQELNSVELQFNYHVNLCGIAGNSTPTTVGVQGVLFSDANLDVTVFTVDNFNAIAQFGYIDLEYVTSLAGDEIFIPQHPSGLPKKLSINSDLDAGRCVIHEVGVFGNVADSDMAYTCDTLGGSSGSPVIAVETMHAVGLHHFGSGGVCSANGSMNQGVRWDKILPTYAYLFIDQFQYNGGFEDGLRDWKGVNLTGDGITGTDVNTGTKAFKFNGGIGEKSKIVQSIRPTNLGMIAGDTIKLSANVNATGTPTVRLVLKVFYFDQPTDKAIFLIDQPTTGYDPFSVERIVQPGAGVKKVKVVIKHNSQSGTTLIDDVRLDWELVEARNRGGSTVLPLALPQP